MPSFKPAYLIHGDDHGRIAERRARLRALAEQASGVQGVELFEGERATAESVAGALTAMTFALGRRFIVVDGAERWKDRELGPLVRALAETPPETTVAFFAREDARLKAPAKLHDAVRKAGGTIDAVHSVKPWELPKWVLARARELGIGLDPEAARALIAQVGERQQRLLRELEKLALWYGEEGHIGLEEVQRLTAPSAERKVWALADALVGGDEQAAVALYLALRAQGERPPGLMYWMAERVRAAIGVAEALGAGVAPAQIRRSLRIPSRAADRLIADAGRAGVARLRAALEQLADLELALRGGGVGGASEDAAMLVAIHRIVA